MHSLNNYLASNKKINNQKIKQEFDSRNIISFLKFREPTLTYTDCRNWLKFQMTFSVGLRDYITRPYHHDHKD